MQDKWITVDEQRGRSGFARNPKKLGSEAIKKRLLRALEGQGIRQPLQPGRRRHEWKSSHGFRRFFNTHALQASMNTLHAEYLMIHKLGLTQSYMKPTEEALFNDYLKAVPSLTIPSGSHTGQIYLSFLREYVLLLSHFAHTANTS